MATAFQSDAFQTVTLAFQISAGVLIPTPTTADRIIYIPREMRTVDVPLEHRIVDVPRERRIVET
jgi:hypothetical protein